MNCLCNAFLVSNVHNLLWNGALLSVIFRNFLNFYNFRGMLLKMGMLCFFLALTLIPLHVDAETPCSEAPDIRGATVTNTTGYVTYNCHPWKLFSDGTRTKTYDCENTTDWQEVAGLTCNGRWSLDVLYEYLFFRIVI